MTQSTKTIRRPAFITLALILAATTAALTARIVSAQSEKTETVRTAPLVTASSTGGRVRFFAPAASVVQIRLEVFSSSGAKLSDSEFRPGNIINWSSAGDGQKTSAQQDGAVLFVVTVRTLSGQLRQRHGLASVERVGQEGRVLLRPTTREEIPPAQMQAWEMSRQTLGLSGLETETREGFVVLTEETAAEQQAATLTAHDGQEGQLTSTSGALTFRTGNLFSGKDVEHARITPEGNVGIGTTQPTAKLDVAGAVRAREGFLFADGSKLNVTDQGGLQLTNADGKVVPNAAGTGTINRVAKWTESGGAGTLGNTQITETNGSVVIGNASQVGNLQVFGTATQDVFAGMGPDIASGPAFNFGYAGSSFGRSVGFFNVRPDASAVAPNPSLRFMTANVERMIVTNTGNVGIGTTAVPSAKLDVVGNINSTTGYNINGQRVLMVPVFNQNTFVGVNAGMSITGGVNNVFVGSRAGEVNSGGSNNSFFGTVAGIRNTFGSNNSFFGVATGNASATASDNSFFGYDAGVANTASENSFFGSHAGEANTTGDFNSFFGFKAGNANTEGTDNSFFGYSAGLRNTTGENNSYFGRNTGSQNQTANNNSYFGHFTGANVTGGFNTFVGGSVAINTSTGSSNVFIGYLAGSTNTTGGGITLIGTQTNVGSNNLNNATAIGNGAVVSTSNTMVLGRAAGQDTVLIPGNLIVTGSIAKGSGSFKIDHPLDPANKTLSHSFVESPDMMNVYNGNITTDARGVAVVTLPVYFEALNRDFRYQLTVIGQFAQAIVMKKIDGNRFQIKTSKPRVEVSWQITGVRQDAFAEAHRIPIEELKPEAERGTYLHPDAFTPKTTVASTSAGGAITTTFRRTRSNR